jgi:hypothetical protein
VRTGSNGLFYFCNGLSIGTTARILARRDEEPEHATEVRIKQQLTVLTIVLPPPP